MKALVICGSTHTYGHTERLLKHAIERLAKRGIPGTLVLMQWKKILPCLHCGACRVTHNGQCAIEGDDFTDLFREMRVADILLIGAPVDLGKGAPGLKALLDRAGRVSVENGNVFSRKLGAPVAVVGQEVSKHTLQRLLTWFPAQDIVVPGSPCYPVSKDGVAVAIRADKAGEEAIDGLVDNLAWLAGKLADPDRKPNGSPATPAQNEGKA